MDGSSPLEPSVVPAGDRVRRGWLPLVVAVVCGGGGLALAIYPLLVPGALYGVHVGPSGYDDGVYFAVAVRFVNGVLPYRDFVFVQPPGIAYVMAPLGLLSRIVGTDGGLALARVLTAVTIGVNSTLVCVALRRSGIVAMAVGGGAIALFPLATAASAQDELEPYVVLFLLVAIVLSFGSRSASPRVLAIAGVSAGFACSIKLVAIAPMIVIAICLLPRWRSVRTFIVGVVIGGGLPILPFLMAAPSATMHEIVFDQIGRLDASTLSFSQRLVMIFGLGSPANVNRAALAGSLMVAFCAVAFVAYAAGVRSVARFEWCVLLVTASLLFEFHLSREFFDHYAYLSAPFLALVLGVIVGRGARVVRPVGRVQGRRRVVVIGAQLALAAAALVAVVVGVPHVVGYEHNYVNGAIVPAAAIQAAVPVGACVVTDQVTVTLVANRFNPTSSGCPAEIDPYGMFLVFDGKHPPPGVDVPRRFLDLWQTDFARADDIVLSSQYTSWIPSDEVSQAGFNNDYVNVSSDENIDVWIPRRVYSTGGQ